MLTSRLEWLIIKIRTNNSHIGNKEVIHMEKKVYVELPHFTGRNVPITEIAAAMHKDAQDVYKRQALNIIEPESKIRMETEWRFMQRRPKSFMTRNWRR